MNLSQTRRSGQAARLREDISTVPLSFLAAGVAWGQSLRVECELKGRTMRSVTEIKQAISEMLKASLPAHLKGEIGVQDAREWVSDHLGYYDEEKAQFPDQKLLPWSNMIAYDDWEKDTFFVIVLLRAGAIELFCGTGYWPDVRAFGEGEADDIPARNLYREWASRFTVPSPRVRLTRGEVNAWLGRGW